jgi:ferrochelatase
MSRFTSSSRHEHGLAESLGVLLVNLGTPEQPTTAAVRPYLRQFLSDPRVIEAPRLLWWLALHGFILRFRPGRSAESYQQIWTDKGSPLLLNSRAIGKALQARLSDTLPGAVHVEVAMSYGRPSIESALQSLYANNVQRILLLPMYPQYSGSTTGSVFDAVAAALSERRWVPEFRFINHYYDSGAYQSALAASVREHWQSNGRGERLLFSFHGLPYQMLLDGDPYHCHCQKTARQVAARLQLGDDEWSVAFQSRAGRGEWLQPYTDEMLATWGQSGTGNIDVICPGFAADCLETLEEIAIRYAAVYTDAGGGKLRYIPALNARADHILALTELVQKHLSGWPGAAPDESPVAAEREDCLQRARAMGAKS